MTSTLEIDPLPHRRRRRWWRILLLVLALLALALGGLWLARIPLAEALAPRVVAGQGMTIRALTITRLDFSGLEITDLAVEGETPLTVETVRLAYTVGGLRDGQIDTAEVRGLALALDLTKQRDGEPFTLPALPVRRATIADSRVAVTTPLGEIAAWFEGEAMVEEGGMLAATLDLAVAHDDGRIDGAAALTIAPDGRISGSLAIDEGTVVRPFGAVRGLAGEARFAMSEAGIEELDAALTYAALTFQDRTFEPGRLRARLVEGRLEAEGTAVWPGGNVAFEAAGDPAAEPLSVAFAARGTVDAAAAAAALPALEIGAGEIRFDVVGDVADAASLGASDLAGWLERVALTGSIGLNAERIMVPGLAPVAALASEAELVVAGGAALVELVQLDLAGLTLPDAFLADLPPDLRSFAAGGHTIRAIAHGGDVPALLVTAAADGVVAELRTGVSWVQEARTFAGAIDGQVMLGPDFAPRAIRLADLALDLGALRIGASEAAGTMRGRDIAIDLADDREAVTVAVAALTAAFDEILLGDAGGAGTVAANGLAVSLSRAPADGWALQTLEAGSLVVNAESLRLGDLRGRGLFTLLSLTGDASGAAARAQLIGRVEGTLASGATVDVVLDLGAALSLADQTLTARPQRGEITLQALDWPGLARLGAPASLALARDAGVITAALDGPGIEVALGFAPFALDLRDLPGGEAPLAAAVAFDQLDVVGQVPGTLRVAYQGLDARVPAYQVVLENGTGTADWSPEGGALTLTFPRLAHTATPAWVTPLGGRAELSLAGETATIALDLQGADGRFGVSVTGTGDLAAQRGEARVTMAPLSFGPGALRPADIAPAASTLLEDVEGTLAARGRITWEDGAIKPLIEVSLDGVGLSAGGVESRDMTGVLTIAGLDPPTTPRGQRLTGTLHVADFDPIPLALTFHLRGDRRVALEVLTAELLGGGIRVEDALLDPVARTGAMTVEARALDLETLLTRLDVEGVAGTGKLTGRMPLAFEDGVLSVADGRLAAEGPGRLQITSPELPALLGDREDTVGLMIEALEDFHFEVLDLSIDKDADGRGHARIRLTGNNPAVLDGHPFVFNINVETDVDRLAEVLARAYSIAEDALAWGLRRGALGGGE